MRIRGAVTLRPLVFRSWTLLMRASAREAGWIPLSYSVLRPPKKRRSMRILALVLALAVAACGSLSPHRIEIQQGNFVTQEMVSQLKPGMTRDQVRFVLGTPLVADIF